MLIREYLKTTEQDRETVNERHPLIPTQRKSVSTSWLASHKGCFCMFVLYKDEISLQFPFNIL